MFSLSDSNIRLDFQSLTQKEFEERLLRISRSNLLQSPLYAKIEAEKRNAEIFYQLIKWNGVEAGIFLNLKHKQFPFFEFVSLHRAPLWFDGFGNFEQTTAFWNLARQKFNSSIFQKGSFIPDFSDERAIKGFKRSKNFEAYETYWLDLTLSEEKLRAKLHKNWVQDLKKASNSIQENAINIKFVNDMPHLKTLIKFADLHQKTGGYKAPSREFLEKLTQVHLKNEALICIIAESCHQILSGALCFIHGQSATYQLGYSGTKGRDMNLQKYLLWQTILALKVKNLKTLDLGGVTKSAIGLTQFKKGMGGEYAKLCGSFY